MDEFAVEAEGLVFSYDGKTAVDGLSIKIKPGEAFGLLGPNGAGKSTTINMLVGMLIPQSGSVKVFGDDPVCDQARQRIGFSPQSLSLYKELSAKENLEFFGRMYGLEKSELSEKVEESLEVAGLSDRRNDRVKTFSGGMKRRLNLATALIHCPQLLLLDEPTVGVDPQSRNHIFDCIERLKDAGLTVLYTTHYMEEAQRLCDRIAIMDQGKILAVDRTDQLVQQHGGASWLEIELGNTADGDELTKVALKRKWEAFSFKDRIGRFQTTDPKNELAFLLDLNLSFQSLQVKKPNLEDVFLNLTGRSLRD